MKGKDIISHAVRAEMPDMEQLRENCVQKASGNPPLKKRHVWVKRIVPAAACAALIVTLALTLPDWGGDTGSDTPNNGGGLAEGPGGHSGQTEAQDDMIRFSVSDRIGGIAFESLESFVDSIQKGALPERGPCGSLNFDLTANKERLLFPRQEREILQLNGIEFNGHSYRFSYHSDGFPHAQMSVQVQLVPGFRTIHQYARFIRESSQWTTFEIDEIIDDKYLLQTGTAAHSGAGFKSISWFDKGSLISFNIWRPLNMDMKHFFGIFDNFAFVDFATIQREVLGQSGSDAEPAPGVAAGK